MHVPVCCGVRRPRGQDVERFGMIVQTADDAIAIHLEIIRVTGHTMGARTPKVPPYFLMPCPLDHLAMLSGALGGIGEIVPQ